MMTNLRRAQVTRWANVGVLHDLETEEIVLPCFTHENWRGIILGNIWIHHNCWNWGLQKGFWSYDDHHLMMLGKGFHHAVSRQIQLCFHQKITGNSTNWILDSFRIGGIATELCPFYAMDLGRPWRKWSVAMALLGTFFEKVFQVGHRTYISWFGNPSNIIQPWIHAITSTVWPESYSCCHIFFIYIVVTKKLTNLSWGPTWSKSPILSRLRGWKKSCITKRIHRIITLGLVKTYYWLVE